MDGRGRIEISTLARPSLVDLNVVEGVFDPSKDHHAWGRWRMAVNDKLMENTQLRETHKQMGGFSHSLTEAPYSECLRVSRDTRQKAYRMMTSDEDPYQNPSRKRVLKTGQFLYYGIPRLIRNPEHTSRDNSETSRDSDDDIYLKDAPKWSYSMEKVPKKNYPTPVGHYTVHTAPGFFY